MSAGDYLFQGQWEDHDYFYCGVNGQYLWYDNMAYEWIITGLIGSKDAWWWASPTPSILGTYTPGGTATGNPVVTVTP